MLIHAHVPALIYNHKKNIKSHVAIITKEIVKHYNIMRELLFIN